MIPEELIQSFDNVKIAKYEPMFYLGGKAFVYQYDLQRMPLGTRFVGLDYELKVVYRDAAPIPLPSDLIVELRDKYTGCRVGHIMMIKHENIPSFNIPAAFGIGEFSG